MVYRLHELVPGESVEISRVDGSVARFVVRKVDQVPKAQFPTEEVCGETPVPELRLITCGGRFDRWESHATQEGHNRTVRW
ncbi:sortase domain-bontaining protein [Actinophytocola sp.]|uniref:sortase domain-containing protein n=1 Tax=Actinophytocola sp. TaxID=1872138 RepID=UPI002ED3EAB3